MDRVGKIKLTGAVAVMLAVVAMLMLWTSGCSKADTTNAAGLAAAYEFTCTWEGQGSDNNLAGVSTLWVLAGGTYTGASLHVEYTDGSSADIVGTVQGNGAVHFIVPGVPGETVESAVASYDAAAEQVNCVVTISHVIQEETTTTTAEQTTTTAEQTTTTAEQTTTTVGEITSTTTTAEQTTTTVGEESSTTTTAEQTTTTVGEESSTTTTVGELTTVTGIQTGGGGTSGPGAGIWVLGLFALALAGGLGWTAVRAVRK